MTTPNSAQNDETEAAEEQGSPNLRSFAIWIGTVFLIVVAIVVTKWYSARPIAETAPESEVATAVSGTDKTYTWPASSGTFTSDHAIQIKASPEVAVVNGPYLLINNVIILRVSKEKFERIRKAIDPAYYGDGKVSIHAQLAKDAPKDFKPIK